MNLGEKSGQSHSTAWDIVLFVLAGGLVGGFLWVGQTDAAENLCMALFGACFGYVRGRK